MKVRSVNHNYGCPGWIYHWEASSPLLFKLEEKLRRGIKPLFLKVLKDKHSMCSTREQVLSEEAENG